MQARHTLHVRHTFFVTMTGITYCVCLYLVSSYESFFRRRVFLTPSRAVPEFLDRSRGRILHLVVSCVHSCLDFGFLRALLFTLAV
ncbi:hypothetical protein V8E55_009128 [Tylopilus felleus]